MSKRLVITGLVRRRSLYDRRGRWHRVLSMNELRRLRRQADLSQRDFAGLLDVPVNTFRMWDSGMRAPRHHDQSFHRIVITCSTGS